MTTPSQQARDDVTDLIISTLTTLASRCGVCPGDPITAIILLNGLIEHAESMLPDLITDALASDSSWHDIAQALGTTPSQAQARYNTSQNPGSSQEHDF
jgi:hypothetical protein